jgi:hypothetical protein
MAVPTVSAVRSVPDRGLRACERTPVGGRIDECGADACPGSRPPARLQFRRRLKAAAGGLLPQLPLS